MSKYFQLQIVCVYLFVFAVPPPCVGQNLEDQSMVNWHYPFTWYWGHGNADIPLAGNRLEAGVTVVSDRNLSGRDLRNARIHLEGGILRNFNFDNANLEGADFTDTILENCSFQGANLKHMKHVGMELSGDFTDAVFREGDHLHLSTEEQVRSTWNFKNGDIIDIMLRDGKIKIEDLRYDQLPQRYRYSAAHVFRTHEFRQKSLAMLTIRRVDFSNCDFSGFSLGIFENCNFDGANFTDAVILAPDVSGEPSSSVPTFGFRECNITEKQLRQTRFWKRGDLTGLALERMNLNGWDFSNMNLRFVSFECSLLKDANFENAIIRDTNFDTDSRPHGATVKPEERFTIEQLKQTRSWKERQIIGCKFQMVNFDDTNLIGFNFSATRFTACSFWHADLTGARILFHSNRVNYGLTEQQIRSTDLRETGYSHDNMLKPVYLWERQNVSD